MTPVRLRPAHSTSQLRRIYSTQHSHTKWLDHRLRVPVTIEVARWLAGTDTTSAADLSCGDGAVLDAIDCGTKFYGDYSQASLFRDTERQLLGPIEHTLELIPRVDMFVCSETLEHLDDPAEVLHSIRNRTRRLVLSTPVDAWNDQNPEHYWAWSREDVESLLSDAGFTVRSYAALDLRMLSRSGYCFGIWGCV